MLTLVFIASLAQPQPGQKLLRADLVRSPKGSNLVLEFAKPIKRTSVPIVPAGRRLVLHLPGPVSTRPGPASRDGRGLVGYSAASRRCTNRARKTLRRPSDRSAGARPGV